MQSDISQTVAPEIGRILAMWKAMEDLPVGLSARVRALYKPRVTSPTAREYQRQACVARQGAAIRQWRRSR